MAEAYEIGISLALEDGVSAGIAAIRRDLSLLDRAIAVTSNHLTELRSGSVTRVAASGPPAEIADESPNAKPNQPPEEQIDHHQTALAPTRPEEASSETGALPSARLAPDQGNLQSKPGALELRSTPPSARPSNRRTTICWGLEPGSGCFVKSCAACASNPGRGAKGCAHTHHSANGNDGTICPNLHSCGA